MPRSFWMLTADDAPKNPRGLPGEWPLRFEPARVDAMGDVVPMPSPWTGPLTRDEIIAYKAARSDVAPSKTRQKLFDEWSADNPPAPDPPPPPPLVASPDGTLWEITISNTGTIGRKKV